MKTQRPFGLSVLTFGMARRLRPVVREQTRLRHLQEKMEDHLVDPTVAKNILDWQRQHRGRVM